MTLVSSSGPEARAGYSTQNGLGRIWVKGIFAMEDTSQPFHNTVRFWAR